MAKTTPAVSFDQLVAIASKNLGEMKDGKSKIPTDGFKAAVAAAGIDYDTVKTLEGLKSSYALACVKAVSDIAVDALKEQDRLKVNVGMGAAPDMQIIVDKKATHNIPPKDGGEPGKKVTYGHVTVRTKTSLPGAQYEEITNDLSTRMAAAYSS